MRSARDAGTDEANIPPRQGRDTSMSNYTVYVGGGNTFDFGSMRGAKAFIRKTWPSAVIGHDGDLEDGGDRTFCWPDDASSVNDDGANAIATITRSDD